MTRRVQIVLLCEDTQHETFARHFLEKMGWSMRRLRVERISPGAGSAEQFVRRQFPKELAAYRSRQGAVGQALVVVLDGDTPGLQSRHDALDSACSEAGMSPRQPNERVAVFVPTWRIETWLAYLDGTTVDEGKSDYPRLRRPRDCKTHVNLLVGMCHDAQLRQPAPASLEAACNEFNSRLRVSATHKA